MTCNEFVLTSESSPNEESSGESGNTKQDHAAGESHNVDATVPSVARKHSNHLVQRG